MEPLSYRLSAFAEAYALLGEKDLPALLREAAEYAKRYEDAPVGECVACDFEGYERPTWHVIDDREAVPLTLRGRVRILLDTDPNPHQ
jgi:hypothetical protein